MFARPTPTPTSTPSATVPAAPSAWEVQIALRSALDRCRDRHAAVAYAFVQLDGWEECERAGGDLEPYRLLFERVLRHVQEIGYDYRVSGIAMGRRALVLVPHRDPRQVLDLLGRLAERARSASWPPGGPRRPVTLSIGVALPDPRARTRSISNGLIAQAGARLDAAVACGGDRILDHDVAPPPAVAPAPAPAEPPRAPANGSAAERALQRTLRELEVVQEELGHARQENDDRHRRQVEILERRIEKLRAQLTDAERELERRTPVVEDDGRPSIYREVQGLDEGDARRAHKLDLLTSIYEANVELRRLATRTG